MLSGAAAVAEASDNRSKVHFYQTQSIKFQGGRVWDRIHLPSLPK